MAHDDEQSGSKVFYGIFNRSCFIDTAYVAGYSDYKYVPYAAV